MNNKDRLIAFAKGFGTMVAFIILLLAGVGSINYGITSSMHLFTVAGILEVVVVLIEAKNIWNIYYKKK